MLYALEKLVRRVLLCMQEVVESGLCLLVVLEIPEVMRCVLLYRGCGGWAHFWGFEISIVTKGACE